MNSTNILFLIAMIMFCNCVESKKNKSKIIESKNSEILPVKLILRGVIREIKDVQNSIPPINFIINQDSVEIIVGKTEKYKIGYENTAFKNILQLFNINDFKSNNYYYNKFLPHGGHIETEKIIDGQVYNKKYSYFKRRDIKVEYLDLDSTEIHKTYTLSKYANELAISIIKDNVNRDTMITAKSMKEALRNPEKIYELTLRSTRTNYISPNIKKLVNLRILDISGSKVTSIPKEIEFCRNLKSIIANASQLKEIPTTIGKLKKLRVINFGYCKLRNIPKEIGELKNLWSLHLGSNKLDELPGTISNLKNLTFFSIDDNQFKKFPICILGLESVGNLWMHENQITEIPKEISLLKRMSHFLVDAHKISNIEEIRKEIPDVRIIDEKKR